MSEISIMFLPIPRSKIQLIGNGLASIKGFCGGVPPTFPCKTTEDPDYCIIQTTIDDNTTINLAKTLMSFSPLTIEKIGHYVYMYLDPTELNDPFYIGEGEGNRCYAHLFEKPSSTSKKVAKIQKILSEGRLPIIKIVRCGLSADEAFIAECTLIDAFGNRPDHDPLTNKIRGHDANEFGIKDVRDMEMTYNLQCLAPEDFDEDAVITVINGTYNPNDGNDELARCTLGDWNIRANRPERLVLGAFHGIVVAVFLVEPSGIKEVSRKGRSVRRRWTIYENAPENIRSRYLHKSIEHLFPLKGQQRRHLKLVKKWTK